MRYLIAWAPVLILELAILFVSSRPVSGSVDIRHLDKVVHFVEYAALGALLFRAARVSGGSVRESVLLSLGLAAVLGIADEALQGLVPERDSSLLDWFADLAGNAAGNAAAVWVGRVRPGLLWWPLEPTKGPRINKRSMS